MSVNRRQLLQRAGIGAVALTGQGLISQLAWAQQTPRWRLGCRAGFMTSLYLRLCQAKAAHQALLPAAQLRDSRLLFQGCDHAQ